MNKIITKAINFIFNHFTLAKLLGGLFTALCVASLKYSISGNFHIEYCDFFNNLGVALLGWTINTGVIGWLTEYLGIKGINFNLNQFIYGFDTMKAGHGYSSEEIKPKFYNAMDLDSYGESNPNKSLDKGKGVDKEVHPHYDRDIGMGAGDPSNENKPLDKGKGRVKVNVVLDAPEPTNPHMVTWSKVFPGVDPASIIPKRTNPGPGFNVPGGEVPIRDEICQHIDYNTHFLNQFKKMDLETAIEQRNNNLFLVRVIETKMDYAKGIFSKIPTIPTTEYDFRLKNQILRDLDGLNRDKIRAEARATLLTSRIEFIEGQINKN
jgi:hypothetical protein